MWAWVSHLPGVNSDFQGVMRTRTLWILARLAVMEAGSKEVYRYSITSVICSCMLSPEDILR